MRCSISTSGARVEFIKKPKPVIKHEPVMLPPVDMSPPKPMPLNKDKKSLPIALIVSAVFLLATAGVASWLFIQKSGSSDNVVTQVDPNSTTSINSVSWVAPKMPDTFKVYDQSTPSAKLVYYPDESKNCSLTTHIIYDGDAVKSAADAIAATATNKDAASTTAEVPAVTISDADGQRTYDFTAASLSEESNSPALGRRVLAGNVYFAHFGHQVAIIRFLCAADSAAANSEGLNSLIKQFTVKTER